MFRRPGKSPLEESSLYNEESSLYKYGPKKSEPAPRVFDTPAQPMVAPHHQEEENWAPEKTTPLPHHFQGMVQEEDPETTLGEGVTFRGELSFERLLRIDGIFEGELLSQGKVVVGPSGHVKANLNLREAIVEGKIEGNITVQEKLQLRGNATVIGDICASSLVVDEGVRIIGHVHIADADEPAETTPPA